jgi:post-segregation antitoxin (ccd killing protein)
VAGWLPRRSALAKEINNGWRIMSVNILRKAASNIFNASRNENKYSWLSINTEKMAANQRSNGVFNGNGVMA